jgi:hypothetical protein
MELILNVIVVIGGVALIGYSLHRLMGYITKD